MSRAALTVGFFALAAAASMRRSTPRACPLQGVRVLFIGDSNAVGLADPDAGAGAPLLDLAQSCGTPFMSSTRGGMGAPFFRSKVASLLDLHRPTLLLVNLGPNDYHQDAEKVRSSIAEIVEAARERGVQLIWISPPPMGPPADVDATGALTMWREALRSYPGALEFKTPILPDRADRVHYTKDGYAALAAAIWKFVAARART